MNHLSVVESWIIKEMLADATLTGIIGQRIYQGVADEEAGDLFAVYSYVDGRPFYNLGTKRAHSWAWYDLMVWQKGRNTLQMKQAANRIDEMFSYFRNRSVTQSGETFEVDSRMERALSQSDNSQSPVLWRGIGGTYKISVTKVS